MPKCRMHSFCPCLLFEKKIFGGLPVARAALLLHCNDHVIAAMVFGLAWGERQMFSRRRCICLPMQQHFWAQGPQNPKYPHFRKNPNHIVVFFRILLCGKRKIYFLGYESMKHPVPHSSNSSNTKRPFSFPPFRFVLIFLFEIEACQSPPPPPPPLSPPAPYFRQEEEEEEEATIEHAPILFPHRNSAPSPLNRKGGHCAITPLSLHSCGKKVVVAQIFIPRQQLVFSPPHSLASACARFVNHFFPVFFLQKANSVPH